MSPEALAAARRVAGKAAPPRPGYDPCGWAAWTALRTRQGVQSAHSTAVLMTMPAHARRVYEEVVFYPDPPPPGGP